MSNYPLPKFSFIVKIGSEQISFTEVSGLNIEVDVIEYRVGDDVEHSTIKMPGRPKYGNISMKRGTFKKKSIFYDWLLSGQSSKVEDIKRDIVISLLDADNQPAVSWAVSGAFPIKIESTDLKADSSEISIESVELAIDKLVFEK